MSLIKCRVAFGIAFGCTVLLIRALACGGTETVRGDETGIWDAGQLSVIIARVVEVTQERDKPVAGATYQYATVVEPISSIAGHIDPSNHRQLHLNLWSGDALSLAIHFVPHSGDIVMVVVVREDMIFPDAAMFMPDGVPLAVLDGVGDKRIVETLHRIQEARSHEKPAAPIIYESTGTTQPAPDHPPVDDKANTPPKKESEENGTSLIPGKSRRTDKAGETNKAGHF
jgi:hypothetical protein